MFFILFACVYPVRAQTTNLLNLCSQEALQAAVRLGGIYQFGDCGTSSVPIIRLSQTLVVERDLSLIATQTVELNGQDLSRVFVVKPGVRLSLRGITVSGGRQTGTNHNDAGISATAGGGIFNDGGTVTLLDGRFENNNVFGLNGRRGADGTADNGESGQDATGGAVFNNRGQLLISNVVFFANSVAGGLGGAGGTNSGAGNGGHGGDGGSAGGAAVYSAGGSVTIYASTFGTNSAFGSSAAAGGAASAGFPGMPGEAGDARGGAVSGEGATIIISGCTFIANTARGANGQAGNAGALNVWGDDGESGGDAAGGAIFSTGPLFITNSTFFANSVISGNGGPGGAAGAAGSFPGDGGDGGNATGGAVESAGTAVIVNCTFSDNVATPGNGGATGQPVAGGDTARTGDTGFSTGGAIFGRGEEAILANSILANSAVTLGGNISDRGGNLSTDGNSLLVSSNSLRLINPLLSGLANNGGPTATMAISTNSPAFNFGVLEFCVPFDQRGSNRLGTCDIGAFETFTPQLNANPLIPADVLGGLSISAGRNVATLRWPAGYSNLVLQFTTNIVQGNTAWTYAPQVPFVDSGSNVVTISTTTSNTIRRLFRLFVPTNSR